LCRLHPHRQLAIHGRPLLTLERPPSTAVLNPTGIGRAAVSKILVSKQDLERIALQAIRSFPGGEDVTAVDVGYRIDKVIQTNWTLHVITRDGANL
jgi:hypothetical protein